MTVLEAEEIHVFTFSVFVKRCVVFASPNNATNISMRRDCATRKGAKLAVFALR
jgi:hypothetical protein